METKYIFSLAYITCEDKTHHKWVHCIDFSSHGLEFVGQLNESDTEIASLCRTGSFRAEKSIPLKAQANGSKIYQIKRKTLHFTRCFTAPHSMCQSNSAIPSFCTRKDKIAGLAYTPYIIAYVDLTFTIFLLFSFILEPFESGDLVVPSSTVTLWQVIDIR